VAIFYGAHLGLAHGAAGPFDVCFLVSTEGLMEESVYGFKQESSAYDESVENVTRRI
jgi:hypothetical protein